MRILSLLFYFSLTFKFIGQNQVQSLSIKKPITDTINYIYLLRVEGWQLKKVMDNNVKSLFKCSKELRFWKVDSLTTKQSILELNQKDTLIDIWWYIDKNTGCLPVVCNHHSDYLWRLKLNQRSNIMLVNRLFCLKDTKLTKLLFKIIKCTELELIIEDMNIKSVKRRYYFQKT